MASSLTASLFPIPRPTRLAFLLFTQGLIPGIINGVVNGLIARNMYGLAETSFWRFPLPYAGDLGVTCLVQGAATYLVVPNLVLLDVRGKRIDPLGEQWPRPLSASAKEGSLVCRVASWVLEDRGGMGVLLIPWDLIVASRAGELKGRKKRDVAGHIGVRLLGQIVKGALWGAALFFLFWPISIAILAPLYTHHPMKPPMPESIKIIFTFILGFFQNYLVALQALGGAAAVYGRGDASVHSDVEGGPTGDGLEGALEGERERLLSA